MEAAGIINRIPVGVIRGAGDYGDEHKNKQWQPYAAAMAAAYAKAVLSQIPPLERADANGRLGSEPPKEGQTLRGGKKIGEIPVSEAAWQGDEDLVKLLLERGADIKTKDGHGSTSLFCPAYKGHEAVTRLLLERDADIEAEDNDGDTPPAEAARYGHEAVVKLLLPKGAELEATNAIGHTPLIIAIQERQ